MAKFIGWVLQYFFFLIIIGVLQGIYNITDKYGLLGFTLSVLGLLCFVLFFLFVSWLLNPLSKIRGLTETRDVNGLIQMLMHENQQVREAAASSLYQIGIVDAQVIKQLEAALNYESSHVRPIIAYVLTSILIQLWNKNDTQVLKSLVAILGHQDSNVCSIATNMLIGIGVGTPSVELLIAIFEEKNERASVNAAVALGQIGSKQAVESLVFALKDTREEVSRTAVRALGKIGGTRAVESLIAALKDARVNVRQTAAETFDSIGLPNDPSVHAWHAVVKQDWQRATDLGTVAVEPLIIALKNSDNYSVRNAAIDSLVQIGGMEVVKLFVTAIKNTQENVSIAAIGALAKIKDERAVEPLIATLRDARETVSIAAAEALAKIKDERAVEPLIAALKDARETVSQKAASALDTIGLPSNRSENAWYVVAKKQWDRATAMGAVAVDPLISVLTYKSDNVREAAIKALCEIGDKKVVDQLIAVLYHKSNDVRKAAIKALGKISDEKAVNPLIVALKDEDPSVILTAVDALCEIGDKKAVDPLIAVLNHKSNNVRKAAIKVLGKIRDERAVNPLIVALKDEDPSVRSIAADALCEIGDKKAVDPLIAILNHKSNNVREAAIKVLGKIRDERAVNPLIVALKDEDSSVRSIAADALCEIGDKRAVDSLVTLLKNDKNARLDALRVLDFLGLPLNFNDDPEAHACYTVAKQDLKTRKTLSVLIKRLHSGNKERKISAANELIAIYRSGNLDAQAKQNILACREIMENPHIDCYRDIKYGDCTGHGDNGGIGVKFSV